MSGLRYRKVWRFNSGDIPSPKLLGQVFPVMEAGKSIGSGIVTEVRERAIVLEITVERYPMADDLHYIAGERRRTLPFARRPLDILKITGAGFDKPPGYVAPRVSDESEPMVPIDG